MADASAPPLQPLLREPAPESALRTLLTAGCVAFLCAAVVSSAAIVLRPLQDANREAERRRHVRALIEKMPGAEALFAGSSVPDVHARVIDLATGHAVRVFDPATFDQRAAALDPRLSISLSTAQDIASIQRRARYAVVHIVEDEGRLALVVLPVHGSGFDSRLYGFVAVQGDANTIVALSFFEHEETPGMGAEIDNPAWRAKWHGKRIRDATGRLRIGVGPGRVAPASPDAPYRVDGLSGATETSEGVDRLLRFWLGPDGFGPYLTRLRREGRGP